MTTGLVPVSRPTVLGAGLGELVVPALVLSLTTLLRRKALVPQGCSVL